MQVFDFPPNLSRSGPTALTFSPDGQFLIVAAWHYQVLDTSEGRWLPPFMNHDQHNVWFVSGGRELAYLDYVTAVAVAGFDTREARRYELPRASGRGLVAAPDGRTLYLLAHLFDEPKGAAVWRFDAATLERRGEFAWQRESPWVMVGSADARRLATGRASTPRAIRIWAVDAPDRSPVTVTPKTPPTQFALSADGGHLATVGTRGVTLWDAATGGEVWTSGKHRRGVQMVAHSPTRPLIATGDNAGVIFLWDFAGRVLVRYDFGLGAVVGLAFAPDGLRCAAAGTKKIVVWDVDV